MACVTAILIAALNPPIPQTDGPGFALMGLLGLGLMTLRSERRREIFQHS